jgi:integrase
LDIDWRDEGSYDREDFDRSVAASGPRHVTPSRPAPSPEGHPLVRLGVSVSAAGYTGGDGAGADGGSRPFLMLCSRNTGRTHRRSIDRADLSCRHLKRFFGGRSAVTVRGVDVVGYADLRLQGKAAVATVNREPAALRRAYRLAIRQGLLVTMPPITTLREDDVRVGFFEADQFEAVCRRLRDVEADVARFCYHTGWRTKSEVFPLKWAQVDWAGGFVRLEPGTTKNREGRAFPMIPALRAILERRVEHTRRCERAQGRIIPWVFHRKGQVVKTMSTAWRTACKKAGVPGRFLHDLRRTAVRNLERASVARSVAMKMTGHKTESVYRRYAIVSEGDLREAGAKLTASRPAGDGLGVVR